MMEIYSVYHEDTPRTVAFGVVPHKRKHFDGSFVIVIGKWWGEKLEECYVKPIDEARIEWSALKDEGFKYTTKHEVPVQNLLTDSVLENIMRHWGTLKIPLRTDLM